jgi:hypothetical protein
VSILTNGLISFDCTPERSRILLFWTSEEAPCISQQLWTLASRLLLRGSSKGQLCSSHSIVNSVIYLCAKFQALIPRINKVRSGGNWFQPVPQVQTSRFSIPNIFWLSNLAAMFPRASRTIMDNSLHVSFHYYSSRLGVMEQAQTET